MFDDSGFKRLRVKVMAPGLPEASGALDRLFESPDVLVSLMEAGIVGGRPYFELEIFGVTSKVDEVLERVDEALKPEVMDSTKVRRACPGPQEAHV